MSHLIKKILQTSLFIISLLLIHLAMADAVLTTVAPDDKISPYIENTVPPSSDFSPAPTNINDHGTLSFDFQDIDVRTLLQLIAKNSGLNFIISDSVKGTITLNLKDVTWERALNIILKARGLTARRVGNIIMISTIEDITGNESKQLKSDETLSDLAPLVTKIIQLKYAVAKDIADILKGKSQLLTPRGMVGVDDHTNSIIVRDTAANIVVVERDIEQLDIPAKQVLIEARLVSIDVNYEKSLGARFGLSRSSGSYMNLSGNYYGANSLAAGTSYANVVNGSQTVDPTQRLNFNNAATSFLGYNAGSIAMAVTKIGSAVIDLELSALEGESHAEIISTPRVMTSNQQKATIHQGVEIPYQEASSSGATAVSFQNADLSLEITPQITPDNKIVLALKISEDTVGLNTVTSSTAGGNTTSVPAINTQGVESSIIINNNETVVLGGIYQQTKSHAYARIPFLGAIPVIGALFSSTTDQDQKTELLIFITPKIVGLNSGTTKTLRGEG